ncbi:MAG: cation diffusion facilitator family transporter [Gammaproteobacteria bacterium]|nr:cation diffusion facilitator family transporter [Gammaproteobacteria bacterium]
MSNASNVRYKKARFVTFFGAVINALLGISKLLGGVWFHSSALVADGFHSLSDLFTDGMVLIASKYGSQDADETHPYGHQRIETAATYVLALLLVLTGVAIAWDALSHLRHHEHEYPGFWALPIAGFSIIANEALFWYTRHVGRAIQSQLIVANAWHHRSDAASSLIVFAGLLGSLAGFASLDGIAALLVGLLIIKMGVNYGWKSIKELIDTGVESQLRMNIEKHIYQTDGVEKVHQLRTRMMGGDIFVDVHVQVHPMISVSEGHFIAQNVHVELKQNMPRIKDVTVHIDPEDDEVNSPSSHLPNRTALDKCLLHHLRDVFPEINACTLHYLDGKLTLDLIGDFDKKTHQRLYSCITGEIRNLAIQSDIICIRTQSLAKPIYESNEA